MVGQIKSFADKKKLKESITTKPNQYFVKDFIYLFLDRGEGREKERERSINVWLPLVRPLLGIWPATQAWALTGNRTSDPLVHKPVINPLSTPARAK